MHSDETLVTTCYPLTLAFLDFTHDSKMRFDVIYLSTVGVQWKISLDICSESKQSLILKEKLCQSERKSVCHVSLYLLLEESI